VPGPTGKLIGKTGNRKCKKNQRDYDGCALKLKKIHDAPSVARTACWKPFPLSQPSAELRGDEKGRMLSHFEALALRS